MKRTSSVFLAVVLVLSITLIGNTSVFAAQSGDFTYTISSSTATITGYTGVGRSVTIPNKLGGYPVTRIEDYVFYGCTGLSSITIPSSVTTIGNAVFGDCTGITSMTIPNSVNSIGYGAFAGCIGLTSITIPSSVTSIGNAVFGDCTGLTQINADDNNPAYSSQDGVLFNKTKTTLIKYPGGKTGSYTIPGSVTNIGNFAFEGCTGLTSITIPSSLTSICQDAFAGCIGLTSITIPNGVSNIEDYAFELCSGLTSINLSSSVTTIGHGALEGCQELVQINVDENNPAYSSQDGVLFNKTKTTLIQYPGGKTGSYTIPGSVTSIGDTAFLGITGLTSITIPGSVTNIGHQAFWYCTELTKIAFPPSVKSIGREAFCGCEKLTAASFLGDAPKIGADVFASCGYKFIIYYIKGKTGFSNPWHGYTAMYTGQVLVKSVKLNKMALTINKGKTYRLVATINQQIQAIKRLLGNQVIKQLQQ